MNKFFFLICQHGVFMPFNNKSLLSFLVLLYKSLRTFRNNPLMVEKWPKYTYFTLSFWIWRFLAVAAVLTPFLRTKEEPNFFLPYKGPPYKRRGHTHSIKKGGDLPPTGADELKSTSSMVWNSGTYTAPLLISKIRIEKRIFSAALSSHKHQFYKYFVRRSGYSLAA